MPPASASRRASIEANQHRNSFMPTTNTCSALVLGNVAALRRVRRIG